MVDNFQAIRGMLKFDNPDYFYFIQIYRRRKDNPDQSKDMILIDNFFIYSYDEFDKKSSAIMNLCISNNARAYIRLNRRSSKQIALKTLGRIAKMIEDGNYRHVKRAYLSCAGEFHKEEDKTWVIDIDRDPLINDDQYNTYINNVITEIQKLIYETGKDDTITTIPTKNGVHLICRPFNLASFKRIFHEIDVHRDNPTLCFCP
jgi:hypothetical protein